MRKKITTAENRTVAIPPEEIVHDDKRSFGSADPHFRQSVRRTLRRYCSIALTISVCLGGVMILIGHRPIGKGLILGTLFSVFNFVLMATSLPLRFGLGRRKTFFISLGSVYLRYGLMAVPLFLAFKHDFVAVSAVAVGLFMVQIAILGDQLWERLRNPVKVNG